MSQKNHQIAHNFKPKKRLGQNFLKDTIILEQIVQSIPLEISKKIQSNEIRLIEIGIGLGDLTKKILNKYALLAYEIDKELITIAKDYFRESLQNNHLVLKQIDVLSIHREDSYLFDKEYFLISNLPYYIATNIILRILKDKKCRGFVVMTQREVAQKFCANVSQKDFCALSILAKNCGDVNYLFEVAPECFIPRPKVDSAVFCFQRTKDWIPNRLEFVLQHAFSSPRKKLFSNLLKITSGNKEVLQSIFKSLGLKENIRPHEVSTEAYCGIAKMYERELKKG